MIKTSVKNIINSASCFLNEKENAKVNSKTHSLAKSPDSPGKFGYKKTTGAYRRII